MKHLPEQEKIKTATLFYSGTTLTTVQLPSAVTAVNHTNSSSATASTGYLSKSSVTTSAATTTIIILTAAVVTTTNVTLSLSLHGLHEQQTDRSPLSLLFVQEQLAPPAKKNNTKNREGLLVRRCAESRAVHRASTSCPRRLSNLDRPPSSVGCSRLPSTSTGQQPSPLDPTVITPNDTTPQSTPTAHLYWGIIGYDHSL